MIRKPAQRKAAKMKAVIFQPALTPFEAAVLPARECARPYGVLHMVPRAWEAGAAHAPQRAKIWVR